MQVTPSDRLAPAANVLSKDLAGEHVLLDFKSGHYFGLNKVGARTSRRNSRISALPLSHERRHVAFEGLPPH